jgi:hypothetical protein
MSSPPMLHFFAYALTLLSTQLTTEQAELRQARNLGQHCYARVTIQFANLHNAAHRTCTPEMPKKTTQEHGGDPRCISMLSPCSPSSLQLTGGAASAQEPWTALRHLRGSARTIIQRAQYNRVCKGSSMPFLRRCLRKKRKNRMTHVITTSAALPAHMRTLLPTQPATKQAKLRQPQSLRQRFYGTVFVLSANVHSLCICSHLAPHWLAAKKG